MKKVFVSGGFGILHAAHIKFFEEAKKHGDWLIVSFACDGEMMKFKKRRPALPESHRRHILESLRIVDEVVMGSISDKNPENPTFDFEEEFKRLKPDLLISTTDDPLAEQKSNFAKMNGSNYLQIPRVIFTEPFSTTKIRENIIEDYKRTIED